MNHQPPGAAVWLVELFAPIDSAEGVLGDLEEEFAGRVHQSGYRAACHWYWRQAVMTIVHLSWGSIRTAPWSTTAQVVGCLVVGLLVYWVMNQLVFRLVNNLDIHDYDTSLWSWRAADLVRFVALPVALGWSIAAFARGRAMIITTLVVGVLVGLLLLAVAVNARLLILGPGQRAGQYWVLLHLVEFFLVGMIFPLGVLVGGTMRRAQRMRRSARFA